MPGDRFYSSKPWFKLRQQALTRDGYRCVVCSIPVLGAKMARIDHILARQQYPQHELLLSNVRTLCVRCDTVQSNRRGQRPGFSAKPEFESVDETGLPDSWK